MASDTYDIHGRLAMVNTKLTSVAKAQRNQSQNYNFRGIDDIFDAIHPLLAEEEVYLRLNVVNYECNPLAKGTRWIVTVEYIFEADDGSNVSCTTVGEAIDYQDKGMNKALQQALKYALIQMFTIPTHEPDPDSFSPEASHRSPSSMEAKDVEAEERAKIAKWIVDTADDLTDDDRAIMSKERETIGVSSIQTADLRQLQLMRDTMRKLIDKHPEETD